MSNNPINHQANYLEGAREICEFLRAELSPNWSERRVRHVFEANAGWPIFKIPGVGLVANKTALLDFVHQHTSATAQDR